MIVGSGAEVWGAARRRRAAAAGALSSRIFRAAFIRPVNGLRPRLGRGAFCGPDKYLSA